MQAVLPDTLLLDDQDILRVDFTREFKGQTVGRLIEGIFETVAACGRRYESTGTSKILHMINPRLFVMWDDAIRGGYAVRRGKSCDYARHDLPRIQKLARRAVDEYATAHGGSEREAEGALCACRDTLAKVIDEYDYAKYTLSKEEVWFTELAPD